MSALLNEHPAATRHHGNQALVHLAPMKRKPIARDSPLSMLKLRQHEVRKCTIKKVKSFVRKLRFL